MYVKDIQTGICAKDGEPVVEKESAATALVDGKNLLGPVVGNFCMNLAIKKAKEAGIGWVVAHGESNIFKTPKEWLKCSYTGLQDICQHKCTHLFSCQSACQTQLAFISAYSYFAAVLKKIICQS